MRLLKFTDKTINLIKFFHGMFIVISKNYQGHHFPQIAARATQTHKDDVPEWQMRIVRYLGDEFSQFDRVNQSDSSKGRIKSAAAKFCSYLVVSAIACLFPIALALDAIDFAGQAIVEITKAAVVIFTTITSPMPTKATAPNNHPENTIDNNIEKKNDTNSDSDAKPSPTMTIVNDLNKLQDGFFAEFGHVKAHDDNATLGSEYPTKKFNNA